MKIDIQSNIRNYEVIFEDDLKFLDNYTRNKNTFFIIDQNIADNYSKLFQSIDPAKVFYLKAIEENKTLEYLSEIYDFLLEFNVKKNITILSIGGGITQDITGFMASTLYRGVSWIFLPTTLLAMTDSCVGSKTSLNYHGYKNLLGTFYPPHKIYITPEFVHTLSDLDYFSGVGEAIKLQLMKDDELKTIDSIKATIDRLYLKDESMKSIILDNLEVKCSYISDDEFDQGKRNLLNYGHCFGHALEASSNYYVPHGIAVTIGMVYANFMSYHRGIINKDTMTMINDLLLKPNILLELREKDFDTKGILMCMKKDKKRIGEHLTVVVINEEMKLSIINDVSDDDFFNVLEQTTNYLKV